MAWRPAKGDSRPGRRRSGPQRRDLRPGRLDGPAQSRTAAPPEAPPRHPPAGMSASDEAPVAFPPQGAHIPWTDHGPPIRTWRRGPSARTTSLLFPNRDQGPWLPFERFAETMTTARTKVERHNHQAEEVFMYVLDGEVQHIDGSGRHDALTPGSTAVLTAHEEMSHELVEPGVRASCR